MLLGQEELTARVDAQYERHAREMVRRQNAQYMYSRPLTSAANDLIDWMGNDQGRLMFGLTGLDAAVRGIANGELAYVTGRAHSGKTQLILHTICSAPERRFLYITPDEVDNLVLVKLIAITHGINAEELEQRIKRGDRNASRLVRQTATDLFGNLQITDMALTFTQMTQALKEAEDQWGAKCEGVFLDYLDLLPGDADYNGTKGKSVGLKRWVKEHHVAAICVHQPKRGGAFRGDRIGMDDMNQGGETEATFVLGVYRKRDDPTLAMEDHARHVNTMSVNLDKNKRPPCHTGQYDYYMDPHTGGLRELRPGDQVVVGAPIEGAQAALQHRRHRTPPDTEKVIQLALRQGA